MYPKKAHLYFNGHNHLGMEICKIKYFVARGKLCDCIEYGVHITIEIKYNQTDAGLRTIEIIKTLWHRI